jgi:NAD(P)-dependent dehydrogenase (short-subunit alcohol dehydrogenase family)
MTEPLPHPPHFSLKGRRALVTGASRGIGLGTAAMLAGAGAQVHMVARGAETVNAAVALLCDRGDDARAAVLDVTDASSMAAYVAENGPFDILVNNAGTNRPMPMTSVGESDFDAVLNLNLRAAFFVAQAVVSDLKRRGLPGSIVNISSQMAHVGAPDRVLYCASKAALEGMTRAMAVEFGGDGIRVNTVCPTFIETEMTRGFLAKPGFRDEVMSKIKLGRLARIDDVAAAVLYLASDLAAMITGTALMVDGGWTAE